MSKMSKNKIVLYFFIIIGLSSCSTTKQSQQNTSFNQLNFLSEYVIPYNLSYKNTTVGGLSGIDYDVSKDVYYLISDDRSDKNPARFYTAKIVLNQNRIDTAFFTKTTFLKTQSGNFYPNNKQDSYHTPDPEAMRYDSASKTFIWSSEGERIVENKRVVLLNPSVIEINDQGEYLDSFSLPIQFRMTATESGPRRNGVFEGLTFGDHNKTFFVSIEEPLYQDGDRAGTEDSTGIIRIIQYDRNQKKSIAQYIYAIDAVAHKPVPDNAFKVNGISDILYVGNNQLMILERSFSTGRLSCTIKVYIADLSNAENVQDYISLKNEKIKLLPKKLLLNMDSLGIFIDNIEGVTFGPRLSNGKQSLLFIADNNFNPFEKMQILLFEID